MSRQAAPRPKVVQFSLMAATGPVRRIGTNLNQALARLNSAGQRDEDLVPAAEFCVRVIRRMLEQKSR